MLMPSFCQMGKGCEWKLGIQFGVQLANIQGKTSVGKHLALNHFTQVLFTHWSYYFSVCCFYLCLSLDYEFHDTGIFSDVCVIGS